MERTNRTTALNQLNHWIHLTKVRSRNENFVREEGCPHELSCGYSRTCAIFFAPRPRDFTKIAIFVLQNVPNVVCVLTVSLTGISVIYTIHISVRVWAEKVPLCIGRDKCSPRASGQWRREKKNSREKVRKRTERRRQQQRGEKFQRASRIFYIFTSMTCRYGLEKPINQTITTSRHTNSAFLCICQFGDWNFSFTATLAPKTFRLLSPWWVFLKTFFEPWSLLRLKLLDHFFERSGLLFLWFFLVNKCRHFSIVRNSW